MTDDEQQVLKNYLLRIGAWEGELTTVVNLAEAQAYALGCADVRLQQEIMASTYDSIIKTLAETLMAERQKEIASRATSTSTSWFYLPVGPEGPRPWGTG